MEFVRNISGELARIAARYLAGPLIAYGLTTPENYSAIEGEVAIIIGMAIGAVTETLYARKKRREAKERKDAVNPTG